MKATWALQGEINNEGTLIEMEKGVLTEIERFYRDLYTSKGQVDLNYLEKLQIPQLPQQIKQYLDRPIEYKEIALALSQMKNSKTPGTDGIPSDFIKFFWPKLKIYL